MACKGSGVRISLPPPGFTWFPEGSPDGPYENKRAHGVTIDERDDVRVPSTIQDADGKSARSRRKISLLSVAIFLIALQGFLVARLIERACTKLSLR
jgi:hypothetical protein